MDEHKEEAEQNNGLEFNTHLCLQCKSYIEGLDLYIDHIKKGCPTPEGDEYIKSEDLKKKEHRLKKELSDLKKNTVEKEGQLKDVQNKILRQERTGHTVKTAQLKIKSEELAISKSEMKKLKLKYNKLLCYLKEKEQEVDQSDKRGDTPEKNYQKSPKKMEKKPRYSKATTKLSDKKIHSEKGNDITRERMKSKELQSSICDKPSKALKEQANVIDSGCNVLESPSRKLTCSETVCINLKESSIVSTNPKHGKTSENESIKDKGTFITKEKHSSNKPEKMFNLELMPDYNTESNQCLVTQDELPSFSQLSSKTAVSCNDTESESQSSSKDMSKDDIIKINAHKDICTNMEKTLKPNCKSLQSVHIDNSQQSIIKFRASQLSTVEFRSSQLSTVEFRSSQQSIICDNEVETITEAITNIEKPIKSDFKSGISEEPECHTTLIDGSIKVDNIENTPTKITKDSGNKNDSVIFLKQLQLPPKDMNIVPLVSTPKCKEEKLDFVDPELSAIISVDEESHDPQTQTSSTNTKSDNAEKPKTATVKPMVSEYSKSTKLGNETSNSGKRKLHTEDMGNGEKRTRINASNPNDGDKRFFNCRRGGTSSATYSGGRFRPNYDNSHYPRSGVPQIPFQQMYQPWYQRPPGNYRGRMPNPNHYNWNYKW